MATPAEVLDGTDVGLLGDAERARSASLRDPADRAAYVAAHLLVRRCAAALTGRPVTELSVRQWCADCGTAGHGRPSLVGLPDVHVSWAHTRGTVVATAAWGRVGVDVEALPADGAAAGRFPWLAPAENRQVQSAADPPLLALRYWLRKECLVKAGMGTLDTMHRIDLSRAGERVDPAGRSVTGYRGMRVVDWYEPALVAQVAFASAGAGMPDIRSFARLTRQPGRD
ncbi:MULTISPECIES: 4'-phosphopantetheinyl transferase family protein [unclassified Modestobacter]